MKKTLLFTILAASLVFTGCAALKGFVHNAEDALNNVMDGTHGVASNVANTVTAPLK